MHKNDKFVMVSLLEQGKDIQESSINSEKREQDFIWLGVDESANQH